MSSLFDQAVVADNKRRADEIERAKLAKEEIEKEKARIDALRKKIPELVAGLRSKEPQFDKYMDQAPTLKLPESPWKHAPVQNAESKPDRAEPIYLAHFVHQRPGRDRFLDSPCVEKRTVVLAITVREGKSSVDAYVEEDRLGDRIWRIDESMFGHPEADKLLIHLSGPLPLMTTLFKFRPPELSSAEVPATAS